MPIYASFGSVTSYLVHGFQNRWLSDRFITTKSSSTVGRHRSICSMQIEPYQGPWGIYTGNDGKLTACREAIRVKYTGRFIILLFRANCYRANETVACCCCLLVSSTRKHFLVAFPFRPSKIALFSAKIAQQNSAFQR